MKYEVIVLTARSMTLEIQGNTPIYSEFPYTLTVGGQEICVEQQKNVISIYDLEPATSYEVVMTNVTSQESYTEVVTTAYEYVRLNVKKFGAVGDGIHLDSTAIQTAILACPKDGTVTIPEGTYLCTPLFLKSDITIELQKGAVLLGHTDRDLYPVLPGYTITTDESDEFYLGTWEGNPLDQYAGLITGIDVANVRIIGEGVLDGNAAASDWWENPKVRRGAWRPRTFFIKGCDHITLQGVTVTNSPSWTIHPYLSSNLNFVDLKVKNPSDSPNTDGLDPESCSDVNIIGVHFSVGDDCIAIKSGKLYMGKKLKQPSIRLNIRNCIMQHGHGAVVIGSEMSGGVQDLMVSKCIFEKTDRGLRIKTRRGRGEDGIIDRISFDNIKMKEVQTPFVMNMFYFCDPDGKSEYVYSKEKLPVDEWTPYLGSFSFTNIEAVDSEVATAYFKGLPEKPIEEVVMKNIRVSFKDQAVSGRPAMMSFLDEVSKAGIVADYVKKIQLDNVVIEGYEGERVTLNGVDDWSEN